MVRQNTSLSFRWRGRQDDWITINDNGVESVTHMYTEALLVGLLHNVASSPLESWRTIDVFIFVLDDQWCMISEAWEIAREKKKKAKISSEHRHLLLFVRYFKRRSSFFLSLLLVVVSPRRARSCLFSCSETLLSIKRLIVFVYKASWVSVCRWKKHEWVREAESSSPTSTTTCCRMAYNI